MLMILIIIFETSWLIVFVKVGLQCKWLITFPALVVLKSCMSLHVSSQVWPVSKTFTTMCTTKGFISSVRSEINVSFQMNRFCLYLKCPLRSHGLEKAFPHVWHLWLRLCVKTCMERAGMLTYIFPQMPHFLAVFVFKLRWVCLCL